MQLLYLLDVSVRYSKYKLALLVVLYLLVYLEVNRHFAFKRSLYSDNIKMFNLNLLLIIVN